MISLWDISAIVAVAILVGALVVRHVHKDAGGNAGCGGGCCKTPGSGRCG